MLSLGASMFILSLIKVNLDSSLFNLSSNLVLKSPSSSLPSTSIGLDDLLDFSFCSDGKENSFDALTSCKAGFAAFVFLITSAKVQPNVKGGHL